MIKVDNNALDPKTTTLADILDLAAKSDTGYLTIKGENLAGKVIWSAFVIYNDAAGPVIDAINEEIGTAPTNSVN